MTPTVRLLVSTALAAILPLSAVAETLRIAIPSDPGYLDPAYAGSSSEWVLIDNLYPRLAKYVAGDEWKVELDAASSVDLSDPANIAFELKPGIMWSGGYGELTAEDVEYSYERHANPDLESALAPEYALLTDVEVTGKYTGIIHLAKPSPSFWSATMTYGTGAIVSKAAAEAAGGYFEATPLATTGPYRFKSFEPGQPMVLEKDPDWIGTPGAFDEIELIVIPDDNASRVAFEAGEVDYVSGVSALEYDNWSVNPPRGGKVALKQSIDPLWLGISETHPVLSDIRVRHAIQKAIDIPTILQATSNGHAQQAPGIVAPGLPGYREGKLMQRDVEGARALIAEAGAEGAVIRLDYVNNANRAAIAQIMQANLAEIGLTVELNGQDEGTFWAVDEERAKDLQLHVKSWFGNPDGLYTLQYFISDQVGVWNWEGLASPDYDALIEKARETVDDGERAVIYVQLQDMLEASGDFLFLTHEPLTALWRDTIVPGSLPDGRPIFGAFAKAAN